MAIDAITIEPPLARWPALARQRPSGQILGRSLEQWREVTRRELNLPNPGERAIIAAGHQPTLWHPGILAKYMAVSAVVRAQRGGFASANLVVDQDVADISGFDIPVRPANGTLAARRIELRREQPPHDLPLGCQPAFEPPPLPESLHAAIESAEIGARLIHRHLSDHASASSAAEQVAAAFDELMRPWVEPMPRIMASGLMRTTLAQTLLRTMADDPRRCAESYNRAVASEPEARLTPLLVRDDYVEVPLWRLRDEGMGGRMRAYDSDIVIDAAGAQSEIPNSKFKMPALLPRALFMTALMRVGACDLFIHGTGGAIYDRAMERWIRDWLAVEVSPMAVVSATLRLPLMSEDDLRLVEAASLAQIRRRARGLWHDPACVDQSSGHPSSMKRALLTEMERLPRGSPERRAAFFEMHQRLAAMRQERAGQIKPVTGLLERAVRLAGDAEIALRRDWAFPLYPSEMLEELRGAMQP